MSRESGRFWSSLPGILTGIAAIITALTGAYVAFNSTRPTPATAQPAVIEEPAAAGESDARQPASGKPASPQAATREDRTGHSPSVTPKASPALAPFPETGPLVDCEQFPTVNTVASLMSWSDHYHRQVVAAAGIKARAVEPCNQAIDNRGMAHCKDPANTEVRAALLDTLTLCRTAGIEWQNIRHSTIIGAD